MENSDSQDDTSERLFAGVDVGGTNIKIGIVDDTGNVLASTSIETRQENGPAEAMRRAAATLFQLLDEHSIPREKVTAIGLGTPGPIDLKKGMLLDPSNLPNWWNFPIRDLLAEQTGFSVSFVNDANAAAMGEFWVGGGKRFSSLVLLTLGTGVGGGIVINDFLIEGAHSLGGECGHICIDSGEEARMCSCGRRGHLEAYASATAVVDRYREKLGQSENNSRKKDEEISAKQIAHLAQEGDSHALAIIDETADYLARGISVFAHTIDPQVIILGGAMNFGGPQSELGQRFLTKVKQALEPQVFTQIANRIEICFAELGGNAGWIGAAAMARLADSGKRTV